MSRGGTRSTSDSEDMEKMMTKVCTKLINQMEEKIVSKLSKLEEIMSSFCDRVVECEASIAKNSESIIALENQLENLEQASKNNCIRVCGMEIGEKEDVPSAVASFIKNKLKIPCTLQDLDFAFVVNSKGDKKQGDRSVVLVRFVSNIKKKTVSAAKKILKDSGVAIFEDLTKKKYSMLVAAKQKYGKNTWSWDGKIFYWDSVKQCKILVTN